jgi:hypothetical protein
MHVTLNANSDSCDYYNNIVADPLFLNDSTYTLDNASKAIDAGTFSFNNLTDYNGNYRAFDGNNNGKPDTDIGLHEVGSDVYRNELKYSFGK